LNYSSINLCKRKYHQFCGSICPIGRGALICTLKRCLSSS